jgi:hypothetical protein
LEKNARIKQSQGKSEQGFPGIQVAKNAKNQAKSSRASTRFSPFATHEIKQYHSK